MSGAFEEWYEPKLIALVEKITWLPELKLKNERQLASTHVSFMAWTTLIWVAVAYCAGTKWFCVVSLLNFIPVAVAEWPPKGRKVDWVTRTLGWVIGAIPAVIILFK